MFERYTVEARRIIYFARHEAAASQSDYIETIHLLLSFFRDCRDVLQRVVPALTEDSVRSVVQKGKRRTPETEELPLSNESKRVLAYGAEEAERLGSRDIDSTHLLLGLLRERKSAAAQLLTKAGAELELLRAETQNFQDKRERESRGRPLRDDESLYCPRCAREVTDPLTCGDCSAVICRVCGTPLEIPEELGMG